jgi:hypothetical protein
MRTEARSLTDDSMTLGCRFCLKLAHKYRAKRWNFYRNCDRGNRRKAFATGVCFKKIHTPVPQFGVRCGKFQSGQIIAGKWSASAAKKRVDQR